MWKADANVFIFSYSESTERIHPTPGRTLIADANVFIFSYSESALSIRPPRPPSASALSIRPGGSGGLAPPPLKVKHIRCLCFRRQCIFTHPLFKEICFPFQRDQFHKIKRVRGLVNRLIAKLYG